MLAKMSFLHCYIYFAKHDNNSNDLSVTFLRKEKVP